MRMRYRTDGSWYAECAAMLRDGKPLPSPYDGEEYRADIAATPPAEPGDTWAIHWHANEGEGPLAGYGICCPRCREIHWWTTATNCTTGLVDGLCEHRRAASGRLGSCWTWTGDPATNHLSASPSLLSHECGWHGWLRDGELSEA